MVSNLVSRGVLTAFAGFTLVAAAPVGSASAFTLSAPSIAAPVAGGNIDRVWWDRWGRWHPNHRHYWGPRPWGWGPPPPRWGYYGYGPVRHCWRGPWGAVHCSWG